MKTFVSGCALGLGLSVLSLTAGDGWSGNPIGTLLAVIILVVGCGLIALALRCALGFVDRWLQRRFPDQELTSAQISDRLRTGARWVRESGQVVILGVFSIWAFVVGDDIGPALRRESASSGAAILLAALGLAAAIKAIQEGSRLVAEIVASRWESEADGHYRKAAILGELPSGAELNLGERERRSNLPQP